MHQHNLCAEDCMWNIHRLRIYLIICMIRTCTREPMRSEKREKCEMNTNKNKNKSKTATAAVILRSLLAHNFIYCRACTYRRRLGNRRLLLMPGIVAIGVTLNSGVENCNRFEPPPLLRFKIGVVVDSAAGNGLARVSNSMSSLMVVPMRPIPLVVPALLPEFELMAIVDANS